MRIFKDSKYRGYCMIFDKGMTELVDAAAASVKKGAGWSKSMASFFTDGFTYWGKKSTNGVTDGPKLIRDPWPEAVALVEEAKRKAEAVAPEPESIKRKPRWTDTEGDISVDRFLGGEQDIYRTMTRKFVQGVPSITLLTNLDCVGGAHRIGGKIKKEYTVQTGTCYVTNPPSRIMTTYEQVREVGTGMYWRSIACAAAVDILENAGYTVDVWAWCNGFGVYKGSYNRQFTAVKIKNAGDPLNLDAMCNATSEWFTLNMLFATFTTAIQAGAQMQGGLGGASAYYGDEIDHLDLGNTFVLSVKNLYQESDVVGEVTRLVEQVKRYQRGEDAADDVFDSKAMAKKYNY